MVPRIALLLALLASPAAAQITLQEAQAEAHQWIIARQDTILDRIQTCIVEGNPRVCHTAFAASVTANTDPSDSALATITLDDPGQPVSTLCGDCFDPTKGTFAIAGIAIPATAPVNARVDIARSKQGWGVQVVIRIRYDGVLYERGYARGILEGFPWTEVTE
jgi:hypothetical protein